VRISRILLAGLLALVACTDGDATPPAAAPAATATTTPAAPNPWVEDMQAFADGVRRVHPNPFWREPEADFDAEVSAAPARLAAMSPEAAEAEVMRLAALIDGHTGVYPFEAGFHLAALHLYLFPNGIHVVNADDGDLVGATVLEIGDTPTAEAIDLVRPYAAHDNNSTIDVVVPMLLMTPEVLRAAGVVGASQPIRYRLRRTDGSQVEVTPEVVTWPTFIGRFQSEPVGLPKLPALPFLARRDEAFWWTELRESDGSTAIYFQYNQVVGARNGVFLLALVNEMRARLDAGGVSRVIVDLRNNPGGDNTTYGSLLDFLTGDERVNRPGGLYVLIGRQTFSAAMNFATEVDLDTAAVFVGEPTGGRPNLYGDVRPVLLPNSHITVRVSSRYWEFGGPDDRRDWIFPDVPVPFTIDAFLAGDDPALETALAI
jgi:hypothetical protein